jgi:mitochondrial translocator assembly and maintenance protein 41
VIDATTALQDLLEWNSLYLAGRMHKPIKTLTSCQCFEAAAIQNCKSAVAAALLMLPEQFTRSDLVAKVCQLSYQGGRSPFDYNMTTYQPTIDHFLRRIG